MDPLSARQLLKEAFRRSGGDLSSVLPKPEPKRIPRLVDPKHRKQHALFTDKAPFLAALAGRGSGKTTGAIHWVLEGLFESARAYSFYFSLTRDHAKELAWDPIKEINERRKLGLHFDEVRLIVKAPGGGKLWLRGVDKPKEVEKARGYPIKRAVIEECGAMGPHLKYLVQEVLRPRTVDFKGQIALIGTANAACMGYFHEVTTTPTPGWSVHHMTMLDNPYMPDAARFIDELRDDPKYDRGTFEREIMARWVRDGAKLVYDFEANRNTYAQLPEAEKWHCVLGIDIGWEDSTAFVVWGWRKGDPHLYELFSFKKPHMTMTQMFKIVNKLRESYRLRAIAVDPAGSGRLLIEEANERWRAELGGLEMEAAEKSHKYDHIKLFNEDLRNGRMKVRTECGLVDEWGLLQWDETGQDEDERFENHLADAALYGWRRAQHFRQKPTPQAPQKGSRAWERKLTRQLEKRHRRQTSSLLVDPLSQK